jgi:hypothetical protein
MSASMHVRVCVHPCDAFTVLPLLTIHNMALSLLLSITLGTLSVHSWQGPHGPRYIEFHPWRPLACVVNELSSTISLFRFNESVAKGLVDGTVDDEPTLELIQVRGVRPSTYMAPRPAAYMYMTCCSSPHPPLHTGVAINVCLSQLGKSNCLLSPLLQYSLTLNAHTPTHPHTH